MQFSVIIPQYNSRNYIEETLKSLQQQTFRDFEVIVIDDGSSDGSFELADKALMELNLKGKVVKRPDSYPKGVSGSRNYGIEIANGDWICFLDSDDLFHSEKLQRTFDLISNFPLVKAFHHNLLEFEDITKREIGQTNIQIKIGQHNKLPELFDLNTIATSTVTIEKALIKEVGTFDPRLNGIEDYFCWLKVSKRTDWSYDPFPFTKYRVRTGSLMGGKPLDHYFNQNHLLLECAKADNEFSREDIARLYHYLFFSVMSYYVNLSIGNYGTAATVKTLFKWSIRGYFKVCFKFIVIVLKRQILGFGLRLKGLLLNKNSVK